MDIELARAIMFLFDITAIAGAVLGIVALFDIWWRK